MRTELYGRTPAASYQVALLTRACFCDAYYQNLKAREEKAAGGTIGLSAMISSCLGRNQFRNGGFLCLPEAGVFRPRESSYYLPPAWAGLDSCLRSECQCRSDPGRDRFLNVDIIPQVAQCSYFFIYTGMRRR